MGPKVIFSPLPLSFPPFFQRPRVLFRQGAIDLAYKNENIKK